VTLAAWIELIWRDELLSWRPEDYEGIEALELPPDKIWIPVSVKDVEGKGLGGGEGTMTMAMTTSLLLRVKHKQKFVFRLPSRALRKW
jgi:hypothetical protein